MHSPGECPVEPSRFKLPLSQPEGPPDQAELRSLFFATVEDSLDIAATLDHHELPAFYEQLRYAVVLAEVGERDRSNAQLDLAVASAENGIARDSSSRDIVEAPEFLREQSVALASAAAALYKAGERDRAQPVISSATEKMNLALTMSLQIPDTFRGFREPIAVLKLAGSLADMGHIDLSEVWRKHAELDLHSCEAHLEVLKRQMATAGEDSPEWHVAGGMQEGAIQALQSGMADALQYGDERAYVKIKDIVKLYETAAAYGIEVQVTDLLEAYERTIEWDRPEIIPGIDYEEDVVEYRPGTDRELEQDYRELADAYSLTDNPGKASAAVVKAMPYIRARFEDGDTEALEDFASAQLQLREHEAEATIAAIGLRYRLEVRYKQARIALDDREVNKATAILDVAMEELKRRFKEAGSDEDEFETGMGLRFTAMYGELGEYGRMDEAYATLEEHNEKLEPWSYMIGENHSKHPPIARDFLSSGNVSRALGAIRFADDVEQAKFLIDLMEVICASGPTPVEAMVIDKAQLLTELRHFAIYLEQQRQS